MNPLILFFYIIYSNIKRNKANPQPKHNPLLINKAYLWPRSKVWIQAGVSEYSNRRD